MSKLFEKIIIIDEGRVIFTEDVEELREKAFYVSGKKETVDDYISGRNIIYSESMGGLKLAGVIQKGIADDKNKLAERGMDLSPIPLQKLFIHITEGSGRDLKHGDGAE
jgi:ABC-2 type transport system ATP-binding protein